MLFVLSHSGKPPASLPPEKEGSCLILLQDGSEFQNEKQKISNKIAYVFYTEIQTEIEVTEAYHALYLHVSKFVNDNVLSRQLLNSSLLVQHLNETFQQLKLNIHAQLQQLSSIPLEKSVNNLWMGTKQLTLLDCFSEDIPKMLVETEQSLQLIVGRFSRLTAEYSRLKEAFGKLTINTRQNEILAIREQLVQLIAQVTDGQLNKKMTAAQKSVLFFNAMKQLPDVYMNCLQEIEQRKSFHANIGAHLESMSFMTSVIKSNEESRRKKFTDQHLTNEVIRNIIHDKLLPVLNQSVPPIVTGDYHSMVKWIKLVEAEKRQLMGMRSVVDDSSLDESSIEESKLTSKTSQSESVAESIPETIGESSIQVSAPSRSPQQSEVVQSLDDLCIEYDSDEENSLVDSEVLVRQPTTSIKQQQQQQSFNQSSEQGQLRGAKNAASGGGELQHVLLAAAQRDFNKITQGMRDNVIIAQLQEEKKRLTDELTAAKEEIDKLQREQQYQIQLEEENLMLSGVLEKRQSEVEQLTKKLADARVKFEAAKEELNHQLAEKTRQIGELKAEASVTNRTVAQLKAEVTFAKDQFSLQKEQLSIVNKKHDEERQRLLDEIESGKLSVEKLRGDLTAANFRSTELSVINNQLSKKLEESGSRLDGEKQSFEREMSNITLQLVNLQCDLSSASLENAQLKKELTESQQSTKVMADELSTVKQTYEHKVSALEKAIVEHQDALVQKQKEVYAEKLKTDSTIREHEEKLTTVTTENTTLREKLTTVNQELDKVRVELTEKMEEERKRTAGLVSQLDKLIAELTDSRKQLDNVSASELTFKQQYQESNQQVVTLQSTLNKRESFVKEMKGVIESLELESAMYQKREEHLLSELTAKEIQGMKLQSEIKSLRSQLTAATAKVNAFALYDFGPDDFVFFQRKQHTNFWELLNMGAPNYYLSNAGVDMLRRVYKEQVDQFNCIKAKILWVEEYTTTISRNPFNLALGTKFFIVDIHSVENK